MLGIGSDFSPYLFLPLPAAGVHGATDGVDGRGFLRAQVRYCTVQNAICANLSFLSVMLAF
jgi:hypothetical protein